MRDDGLGCGRDFAHRGMVPAPTPAEATVLARLQRGGPVPDMTPPLSHRIAYLILRYHAWGQHIFCHWLPALGLPAPDCQRPAPRRIASSMW